ncbi:MAG: GDSL-type esterase/lipase family protein [Acidobacteriota bacterium]
MFRMLSTSFDLFRTAPAFRVASVVLVISLLMINLGLVPQAMATEELIAFGDSITLGFGDGVITCDEDAPITFGGYTNFLEQDLASLGIENPVVLNYGVCGELTSQAVSRLDDVLLARPDARVVLLMEGTNDLSSPSISVESVRFNINQMATKIQDTNRVPVVASVIPRDPECGTNDRSAFFASVVEEDAMMGNYPFVDQFDRFIDIPDLYEDLYSDPWHLNPDGYDIMAATFAPTVADSLTCDLPPGSTCVPSDDTLCLNQGRFQVEVDWTTAEGERGAGNAQPRTDDTGLFWFFTEENIELVVKVLDGRPLNGNFWVFYGALSNVGYSLRIIDTESGVCLTYDNPLGTQASVGDTSAFPGGTSTLTDSASTATTAREPSTPPQAQPRGGSCQPDDEILCLGDRFALTMTWQDFSGTQGAGQAVALTSDTGYFWFFDDQNIELVVKVLDGTAINGNFWVFFGALSNVAFNLEVTDTTTGQTATYFNALGTFASRSDIEAFPPPEE